MRFESDTRVRLRRLCRSRTVLVLLLVGLLVQQSSNLSRLAKKAFSDEETPRRPDVSYVPTPQKVVDRMLELAEVTKDDVVYDLGCGDGRIVITAAREYGCRAIGYDIVDWVIEAARENVAQAGVEDLVKIERADIFTLDLSDASVITLYLLPDLNVRLIPQLEKLRPGVRIVSHNFDMKGVQPDQVVTVKDAEGPYDDHTVFLWTTPLKKEVVTEEDTADRAP
jgi:protein-L-isoaspartate O-methyltransferase